MFKKPTVFSDEAGSHVLGKDGNIKASFTIADHGSSHEGAAVAHLQQNFDSYMGEEIDKGLEDELMAQRQTKKSVEDAKKKYAKEEVEELDEGRMKLDKVNHVYHDDDADTKKFSRDYVNGHKGDYSSTGPTEKDDKNSEKFHTDYDRQTTRSGFAGSGTHIYTHKATGKKFKVDKTPNGKTFYGTDHHVIKLHEAVKNPYAVGMAAAEKSTGDTPPLKKSTITKAHKIAKEVMKENKLLVGALKRLEEGRGRPPKEGSAAWHRRQAEQDKPKEEPVALGMQLRKAKSINSPVTFDNGEKHQVHHSHADRFEDHMAARKTTQEKAAFQKKASASHEAFKKAVSEPLPNSKGGGSEVVKYR